MINGTWAMLVLRQIIPGWGVAALDAFMWYKSKQCDVKCTFLYEIHLSCKIMKTEVLVLFILSGGCFKMELKNRTYHLRLSPKLEPNAQFPFRDTVQQNKAQSIHLKMTAFLSLSHSFPSWEEELPWSQWAPDPRVLKLLTTKNFKWPRWIWFSVAATWQPTENGKCLVYAKRDRIPKNWYKKEIFYSDHMLK